MSNFPTDPGLENRSWGHPGANTINEKAPQLVVPIQCSLVDIVVIRLQPVTRTPPLRTGFSFSTAR